MSQVNENHLRERWKKDLETVLARERARQRVCDWRRDSLLHAGGEAFFGSASAISKQEDHLPRRSVAIGHHRKLAYSSAEAGMAAQSGSFLPVIPAAAQGHPALDGGSRRSDIYDSASRISRDRAAAEVWDKRGMQDAATSGSHTEQVAEEACDRQTDWGVMYDAPSGPGGESGFARAASQSSSAGFPVFRSRAGRRGEGQGSTHRHAEVAVSAAAAAANAAAAAASASAAAAAAAMAVL